MLAGPSKLEFPNPESLMVATGVVDGEDVAKVRYAQCQELVPSTAQEDGSEYWMWEWRGELSESNWVMACAEPRRRGRRVECWSKPISREPNRVHRSIDIPVPVNGKLHGANRARLSLGDEEEMAHGRLQ